MTPMTRGQLAFGLVAAAAAGLASSITVNALLAWIT